MLRFFIVLQLSKSSCSKRQWEEDGKLASSHRLMSSPKLEALKKMAEEALASVNLLEEELASLDEASQDTSKHNSDHAEGAPYYKSLHAIREEFRAQVSRFRPLRHLNRDLIQHTSAWRARGMEDIPHDFDENYYPAHCFWRKSATELACLPSFFVLGTPKSGTTALWDNIVAHPDVIKVRKEPHWWTLGSGRIVDKYINSFYSSASSLIRSENRTQGNGRHLTFGDASASTFWYLRSQHYSRRPFVPELLHSVVPSARLIVLFREPSSRLVSEFGYFSTNPAGIQPETFGKAVDNSLRSYHSCVDENPTSSWFCPFGSLKGGKPETGKVVDLRLGIGIYVAALTIWRGIWGEDPLLVLRSEDLACSTQSTMDSVYRHIGVRVTWDGKSTSKRTPVNARGHNRKFLPSTETIRQLKHFYRPFNRQLAALMGDPRFLWEDNPCNTTS